MNARRRIAAILASVALGGTLGANQFATAAAGPAPSGHPSPSPTASPASPPTATPAPSPIPTATATGIPTATAAPSPVPTGTAVPTVAATPAPATATEAPSPGALPGGPPLDPATGAPRIPPDWLAVIVPLPSLVLEGARLQAGLRVDILTVRAGVLRYTFQDAEIVANPGDGHHLLLGLPRHQAEALLWVAMSSNSPDQIVSVAVRPRPLWGAGRFTADPGAGPTTFTGAAQSAS